MRLPPVRFAFFRRPVCSCVLTQPERFVKLPANLDLNLLKTLHVLLQERNVTRAAGRPALSQPAVSGMPAQTGLRREVAVSVQSFAQIPEILRQSDLLAVVPPHLVRGQGGLAVRELPFAVREYSELLLWHERSHADPVQKWLRAQLAEAAAEGADGQEAV